MTTLLAGFLASGLVISGAQAQADRGNPLPDKATRQPAAPRPKAIAKPEKPETAASWQAHHSLFFQRKWGVDIVGVHRVSSGFMLRFNYRVVDAQKAAALTDRKAKPYLIDEASKITLAVPAMENVGELRQVAPLELNRTYFIIFGNPGGLVKRGSRVTIVVGHFRVEGLPVD